MEIERIDPEAGLVETTPAEAAALAEAVGHVMILHRDGKMFRVIDPWERDDG